MKELSVKDKELLVKDLSARVPYEVIVAYKSQEGRGRISLGYGNIGYVAEFGKSGWWIECKPYLRSMDDMTEKEKEEYLNIDNRSYSCPMDYAHIPASDRIDWLNAHHFDFRNLIGRELALKAPEGMYNLKVR